MEELINKVVLWSKDRNLHTADSNKQLLKLWEEFGELNSAIARDNRDDVIDAIGDMLVVMIIYCQQNKYYSIYRLFEFDIENYEFLRKLETEVLIDSTAYEILHLRNFIQSIKDIVTRLCIIAERYDAELDWCLKSSYDEIKDRRRKMING